MQQPRSPFAQHVWAAIAVGVCVVLVVGRLALYEQVPLIAPVAARHSAAPAVSKSAENTSNASPNDVDAPSSTTGAVNHPTPPPASSLLRSFEAPQSTADGPDDVQIRVPKMYGLGGPRIDGIERCRSFREAVPAGKRRWAVAGFFNTGTNYAQEAMVLNCRGPVGGVCSSFGNGDVRNCSGLKDVPWGGKHYPAGARDSFVGGPGPSVALHVMPIVVIKDPLTWMKSMCHHPYGAQFAALAGASACPSPLNATSGSVGFSGVPGGAGEMKSQFRLHFASLIDLWNQWYRGYMEASYPRLVVRYEDLLFDTRRTVAALCTCTGGEVAGPSHFDYVERPVKFDVATETFHEGKATHVARYQGKAARYVGYSQMDIDFMQRHLDQDLIQRFHYDVEPRV